MSRRLIHIAFIPARAGSKSIIGKNLRLVGGKSLVSTSIHHAKTSGIFDRIYLSTNIPCLIEDYQNSKSPILARRTDALSQDNTRIHEVVEEWLKWCFHIHNDTWIWLLQPTTPFRYLDDFSRIKDLIAGESCGSVIAVKPVGDDHRDRDYTIVQDELRPLRYTGYKPKQELPRHFRRSGAYYVFKAGSFRVDKSFESPPCRPYLIDWPYSLNIDEPKDLLEAQSIARMGLGPYLDLLYGCKNDGRDAS